MANYNNTGGGIPKWAIICIIIAILYMIGSVSDNNSSSTKHVDYTPHENYTNIGCSYPGCVNGRGNNPTYCDWHTKHH